MKKDKNLECSFDVDKISNIMKSSIIGLVITLILLILSIIFKNQNNSLSMLNYTSFLIFILFSFIFFILFIILSKKDLICKKSFTLFDLLSLPIKFLLVITFTFSFVFSIITVSGSSMNSTYEDGDVCITYNFLYNPKLNDVVVIDKTDLNMDLIIKRIVATSNDDVVYYNNALYVNNEYVCTMDITTYFNLLTDYNTNITYDSVPDGFYIVLGDNRDNSVDSRRIGLINKEEILGKSIFRVLPLKNIGIPKENDYGANTMVSWSYGESKKRNY